jgi:hypothetical protein
MAPMDFHQDGKPRDPQLYGAVQVYAKNQFGEELVFPYYAKVWAALAQEEGQPYQVIGILALRNAIDVCTFHVSPPTLDKNGLRLAEQARDMMFVRGHDYIADLGNTGYPVLVYVAEEAQRYWRKFLKRIGAKQANRFEVKI